MALHFDGGGLNMASLARAAMVVRINTLPGGGAGASPQRVTYLLVCLHENLIPELSEFGSIGASDICPGETRGTALVDEGGMGDASGVANSLAAELADAGAVPLVLAVRDELTLGNHARFNAIAR